MVLAKRIKKQNDQLAEEERAEAGRSTLYDFNDAKTRVEKAEADLVQAKYEFVFRAKILDYYRGEPLRL